MHYRRPLWKHQEEAIRLALPLRNFGIFNGPGTGKTATVINILRHKFESAGRVLRTLVVAPPITLDNWRNEWLMNSEVPGGEITVLSGSGKARAKKFTDKAFKDARPIPHIFIMNYEALLMDELFNSLQKWGIEAVVFDEAHRLASYKSKRSKRADALANPGTDKSPIPRPLVYCLTGTPVMNNLMDIFQQYKVLDGGAAFGKNFFGFRSTYFRDKNAFMNKQNHFPNWQPIPGAAEIISEKMKQNSMRVRKEDCIDLPELVEITIPIEMTKEQQQIYKSMFDEFIAFFERGEEKHTVMATMAITKGLRLMQIASGFVKTDEGAELAANEGWTPKQDALYELLSDLVPGNKVIIWAVWRYNYKQIREVCDKLKIKMLELNGDMGPAKNRANAALFESSEEYPVIIAHPESAGEGLNLISANTMISFSRDFSWRRWEQCIARNYRGGSTIHDKVTRYILVAKDTVEEKITKMLAMKEEISETVLRDITLQLKGK